MHNVDGEYEEKASPELAPPGIIPFTIVQRRRKVECVGDQRTRRNLMRRRRPNGKSVNLTIILTNQIHPKHYKKISEFLLIRAVHRHRSATADAPIAAYIEGSRKE